MSEQTNLSAYRCIACGDSKPIGAFFLDRRKKYNIRPHATCKACISANTRRRREMDPERFREWERKSYRKRYEEQRDGKRRISQQWRLKRLFGLTVDEFVAMYERHGRKCAVCDRPVTIFTRREDNRDAACVDHCHATGRIRGILCNACNTALGLLRDDPARIARLREYLIGGQQ